MYRGEIWWANLPDPLASEPGYRRPILIVQDDIFTQSRISTVIVVIITSNTQLAQAPGNVLLPREATGLPRDSVANVSQIFTVDKTFLVERVGSLPEHLQEEIDEDCEQFCTSKRMFNSSPGLKPGDFESLVISH